MKKILPLLAGLLFFSAIGKTQSYYFRHYQVENGLSNNTVFCSTQDKNGFLWFGTKDGLNRFDGYQFKTFNINREENSTLNRDLISSLATDQKGTVWVGTQRGLLHFDAEKERFTPFLDTIHGINDIFFDKKGQLWFTADFTLNLYNFGTKQVTRFPPKRFFEATSFCESSDGTMWFSTKDGYLQHFDAATQTFKAFDVFKHSPPTVSRTIQKIVFNNKGSILIGTNSQGVKEFELSKLDYKDVLTCNPDKTSIFVHDIMVVNEQEIWFATESGIFIRNNATGNFTNLKKKYLDPYSLTDNAVYTLYQDNEKGIWAGTFFGGLNYFPNQYATFQKFFPDYTKNSISGNAVREICEDNNGNIWIGTEDAGLNKLNPRTGLITHFEPTGKPGSISYYNIHGLLVVKDQLWIGTFHHGLDVMNINTGKVVAHYGTASQPNRLKRNFIVSSLQTRNGEIYFGTGNGICLYNQKNDNFLYPEGIAEGSVVPCLLEDHEGVIWVASSSKGLFYFNPLTGTKGHFQSEPGNENSISHNSINSIYEDSYGNLWFATDGGGLCRLNKARKLFTRYTTKNGLPSKFIFKVLEDNKKTLWVTTSKGLVNLNLEEGTTTVYTKANGLLNDQFNYNSGYRDKQGNLYFGSVQGMIKFNPAAFHSNPFTPPVYITGLQVQNKEITVAEDSNILKKAIPYADKITLPYNQSSFSIDFTALSFTSPEMTEYSYIMDGLDKEWTYLKSNRKVYFTNLKAGTYTFNVKAKINGASNQQVKKLIIIVTPPFWATPWANSLYILMAGLLIYYVIRTYHHIQETRKAKEIYQAKMDFFTNVAHEIKTPLTLIKGPVENLSEMISEVPAIKEDVVMMEKNISRLINLMNQILDFRQTETKGFSLDFSEVNINYILQDLFSTFKPLAKKRNLSYTLTLPSGDVSMRADAEALNKIFSNLFSNAVKYAQTEVNARLIQADENNNKLVFEISNDGYVIPKEMKEKIFEPFFRIKETNKLKGTGLGLALARSLVELHNGKIYVKDTGYTMNVFVVEFPYSVKSNQRQNTILPENQIAKPTNQ